MTDGPPARDTTRGNAVGRADATAGQTGGSVTGSIRDLSDFCEHWPSLRPYVVEPEATGAVLTERHREVLEWLVLLADRVCRLDVGAERNGDGAD